MKKMMLVALVAVIAGISCNKEHAASDTVICTTAMVHYGGDPLADGLGWILVTDTASGQYEVADNLENSFKTEGLLVDICYYKTDVDFVCFCPPPVKKIIHITSIKLH